MTDDKLSASGLNRALDQASEETLWQRLKRLNPAVVVWHWFIRNFSWPALVSIGLVLLWAVNLQGRVTVLERVILVEPEALERRVRTLEENWEHARCVILGRTAPGCEAQLIVPIPMPAPSGKS